jgi:uncharacterized protein (DUF362 family)
MTARRASAGPVDAAIVTRPGTTYPHGADFYSPSERYPEYPFEHLAEHPNPVYEMVRDCLRDAGLDAERFGSTEWNPLRKVVPEGSSVFVLCNFVLNQRPGKDRSSLWAMCTHGSVLRAVVDYVLRAVGPSGRITFGNAPLQSTAWERVMSETGAARVLDFYRGREAPVSAEDLRLFVRERDHLGRTLHAESRNEDRAVNVELGTTSLLTDLYRRGENIKFRVNEYDPRRTESCHSSSHHRYIVNRSVLESDVVLSLPKLKTHQKVGITCGLKGFVGAVALKDCLAHHRFGDPGIGGDEYPKGFRPAQRSMSRFHDWVWGRSRSNGRIQTGLEVTDRNLRRILARTGLIQSGGWHGNDTAWRMALDLARILHYADSDGGMHDRFQRRHLSLIDGVVGGEREGPLGPEPVDSGVVLVSRNVALGDRLACRLMGFDPDEIRLTREALRLDPYPLEGPPEGGWEVRLDGLRVEEEEVPPGPAGAFIPPAGWREALTLAA